MKTIYIGNDHAGPDFVSEIMQYCTDKGFHVEHVGAFGTESVDYPEYGAKTAQKVVEKNALGIVICGTGIGISIAANKIHGARCANCISPYMAEMAKKHNNANVLALGARIVDIENAKTIVDMFLSTEFEGERHQRRVSMLDEL